MVDKLKKIWMDGVFVDWNDAKIHILTHTLHYGYGAFEGIRAYRRDDGRSAVFRLDEHLERLFNSCKLLELKIPYRFDEIKKVCVDALKINGLAEGYIRPLVYIGDGSIGVYPGDDPNVRCAVMTWVWGAYLGEDGIKKGIRIKISTYTKFHNNSVLIKGKIIGHYVNSVLAKMEARREGYTEGLLLDQNGYVCEGSGENVFVVRNGEIFTPGHHSAILNGITRATIIELAQSLGYKVHLTNLTRNDLYTADEVFFTGTAAEVTPIREIDRRTIGKGGIGPVTEKIQNCFFDVVKGRNDAYNHWMTFYSL